MRALWSTAQNYRDNTQAALPSYRERIVEIAFAANEGGLNLAMGPDQIQSILAKGDLAGRLLTEFDFDHHRWVRLLVLMGEMEKQLEGLERVLDDPEGYHRLLRVTYDSGFPYQRGPEWREEADEWLQALHRVARELSERRRV